jgi:hypothetical protein
LNTIEVVVSVGREFAGVFRFSLRIRFSLCIVFRRSLVAVRFGGAA